MTADSPDRTADDRTTTSRTAAKAHAASVPTAYSAVVIPASTRRDIRPDHGGWAGYERPRGERPRDARTTTVRAPDVRVLMMTSSSGEMLVLPLLPRSHRGRTAPTTGTGQPVDDPARAGTEPCG